MSNEDSPRAGTVFDYSDNGSDDEQQHVNNSKLNEDKTFNSPNADSQLSDSDQAPAHSRGARDKQQNSDVRPVDSNRTSGSQSDSDDRPMYSLRTGSRGLCSHDGKMDSPGDNGRQSDSGGSTESLKTHKRQAYTDRSDQLSRDSYRAPNVKSTKFPKKSDDEGSETAGNEASGGFDSGGGFLGRSPSRDEPENMDVDCDFPSDRKFSNKFPPGKDTRKEPRTGLGVPMNELLCVSKTNYKQFYPLAHKVTYDMRCPQNAKLKVHYRPDQLHVKLPHMPTSDRKSPSWKNDIHPKLLSCSKITRAHDVQEIIRSYNKSRHWSFSGLMRFLDMKSRSLDVWHVIARMGRRASRLPDLFPRPLPLLKKGIPASITLSRAQIACLLCNAFFCTFPMRENESSSHRGIWSRLGKSTSVDASPVLPTINFFGLFQDQHGREKSVEGKLSCLFNYFDRITRKIEPEGCVTFERLVCERNDYPDWPNSPTRFTKLHVRRDGFIEDEGKGMLQVDFANKLVGGGVLGRGCVQEEIRFVICPELIVSRLFTEELEDNETLLITGCERFSNFEGYARSFSFTGNCEDKTDCAEDDRRLTQVIAMDAQSYKEHRDQFHPRCIKRELRKAYCGFHSPRSSTERLSAVATGNWGCGAFRGDRHLKALIQLMAAAEAGRDVLYITIDDGKLVEDLWKVHSFIRDKNLTVGDVFEMIRFYSEDAYRRKYRDIKPLFDYILDVYANKVHVSGSRAENTEV